MDQFVPEVTEADIERIIKRDFPLEEQENVPSIIRELEVGEKPRVVLACLKNSGGDIQKLKNNLAEAPGYYREILGEAEYPNYMKKAFHIEKLSDGEKAKIIEKDKNQYLAWLHGRSK